MKKELLNNPEEKSTYWDDIVYENLEELKIEGTIYCQSLTVRNCISLTLGSDVFVDAKEITIENVGKIICASSYSEQIRLQGRQLISIANTNCECCFGISSLLKVSLSNVTHCEFICIDIYKYPRTPFEASDPVSYLSVSGSLLPQYRVDFECATYENMDVKDLFNFPKGKLKTDFINCQSVSDLVIDAQSIEWSSCAFIGWEINISGLTSLKSLTINQSSERSDFIYKLLTKLVIYNCENLEKVEIKNNEYHQKRIDLIDCGNLECLSVDSANCAPGEINVINSGKNLNLKVCNLLKTGTSLNISRCHSISNINCCNVDAIDLEECFDIKKISGNFNFLRTDGSGELPVESLRYHGVMDGPGLIVADFKIDENLRFLKYYLKSDRAYKNPVDFANDLFFVAGDVISSFPVALRVFSFFVFSFIAVRLYDVASILGIERFAGSHNLIQALAVLFISYPIINFWSVDNVEFRVEKFILNSIPLYFVLQLFGFFNDSVWAL